MHEVYYNTSFRILQAFFEKFFEKSLVFSKNDFISSFS